MISRFFFNIGKLFSFVFPHKIQRSIRRCYNKILTGYKASDFAKRGWPINIGNGSVISGESNVYLGDNVSFGIASVIETYPMYKDQKFNPKVTIGNNCIFGDYTHITCIDSITIGNNLLTGRRVLISDNSHGTGMNVNLKDKVPNQTIGGGYTADNQLNTHPINRHLVSKGPIVIGNNVWLGDNVCILSGVTIGDNAVIGANTVVSKDVPPYSIAVGAKQRM